MQDARFRIQDSGFKIQEDPGFRIQLEGLGIEFTATLRGKTPNSGQKQVRLSKPAGLCGFADLKNGWIAFALTGRPQ